MTDNLFIPRVFYFRKNKTLTKISEFTENGETCYAGSKTKKD